MNTEYLLEKTFKKFNKKSKKPKKKQAILKISNKQKHSTKHHDEKSTLHHTLTSPLSGMLISSKKGLKDRFSYKNFKL